MAIKIFISFIIVIGVLMTQLKVEQEIDSENKQKIPLVVFYDSLIYELDESHVQKTVQSKQILHFDTRDEMYDGTIIIRTNKGFADSISAEYIMRKDNDYKFYQNVHVATGTGERIVSDRLSYNNGTKVISSDRDFTLYKDESTLVGTNLYFDTIKKYFKADDTHFIIRENQ